MEVQQEVDEISVVLEFTRFAAPMFAPFYSISELLFLHHSRLEFAILYYLIIKQNDYQLILAPVSHFNLTEVFSILGETFACGAY